MKLSANEIVENKRLITTPNLEIKKSSLAVGKFVWGININFLIFFNYLYLLLITTNGSKNYLQT